jgi:hypothetical protein
MTNRTTEKLYNKITQWTGRYCLLFFLLTSTSLTGWSQQWPHELWHEGKVYLSDGDTLKGLVKYDLQQDIVQFTQNDKSATVFSARKVLFFEIFDATVHSYRQFFALPYSSTGSYASPIFFELLAEGKLTLLCREALEYRSVPVGYYGATYNRLTLVNNFFFLNEKGDISSFNGKKHDLMDLMGRNADAVEKYIRSNRLKMEDKADFSKIITYYNSLHRS